MTSLRLQGARIRPLPRSTFPRLCIRLYTTGVQCGPVVSKQRGTKPRPGIISTLNPKLLQAADVLDISQIKTFSTQFLGPIPRPMGYLQFSYARSETGRTIPFPAHSRGFLYYHSVPLERPLEGSLRFRVTPDNTPSSFSRGQDLLCPWGTPWQIMLPQIAGRFIYSRIRAQLLDENLATEE
ncbi:hypothetical protein C8R44DRAFT_729270 [Mycena epipterygia]|nr:hypothetical protein C8R44DRAFT_729270 [Mycena epipterygia]